MLLLLNQSGFNGRLLMKLEECSAKEDRRINQHVALSKLILKAVKTCCVLFEQGNFFCIIHCTLKGEIHKLYLKQKSGAQRNTEVFFFFSHCKIPS